FKQADVLDGDAGSAGQGDDDVLVVQVEGLSVEPFGQVEVTVDLAADADGDAQQGVQVRVAGREPGGGRMGRDVVDPQGFGVADQVPEDTATTRQIGPGQVSEFLVGQPGSDELVQSFSGLIEDAQCPVAGTDQVHGGG